MTGLLLDHVMTVLTAIIAVGGLIVSALLIRDTSLGWWIIAGFVLTASDFPFPPPLFVAPGGVAIYPADAAVAALLASLVLEVAQDTRSRVDRVSLAWLVVGSMAILSLLRGLATYDAQTVLNEVRNDASLVVASLWVVRRSSDPAFTRTFSRFVVWTGWGLCGVAVWHIATRGIGSADLLIEQSAQLVTSRPLVAAQALFLVLAFVVAIAQRRIVSAAAFLVVIVLCQHRSVWIAGIVAAVALLMLARRISNRAVLGVLMLTATVSGVAYSLGYVDSILDTLVASGESRGTLDGRLFDWQYLVSQQNALGGPSIMMGQPFGTGYARPAPQGTLLYAPHNWFVVIYLRIGLIGLVAFGWVLLARLAGHLRRGADVQLAALVALIAFSVFYFSVWTMAPLVALALMRRDAIDLSLRRHRGSPREEELSAPHLLVPT